MYFVSVCLTLINSSFKQPLTREDSRQHTPGISCSNIFLMEKIYANAFHFYTAFPLGTATVTQISYSCLSVFIVLYGSEYLSTFWCPIVLGNPQFSSQLTVLKVMCELMFNQSIYQLLNNNAELCFTNVQFQFYIDIVTPESNKLNTHQSPETSCNMWMMPQG